MVILKCKFCGKRHSPYHKDGHDRLPPHKDRDGWDWCVGSRKPVSEAVEMPIAAEGKP